LAVCLPAVLSVKPRNSSHLQCRDRLGAQKVPHRRCVSFSHTYSARPEVAVVVRPLRRECVHTALPAFLRVVWLVHALPARGMVRVVGEEPAIQTFPPLTLFRSGWRARWWAEAESRRASGWVVRVRFQITSPCVRSADYCTLPYARSSTTARRCSPA
jgi:hypothetical protein